jgi:Zn-dependent protease
MACVAAAGPLSNFVVAFLGLGLLVLASRLVDAPFVARPVAGMLRYVYTFNLGLAIFNLIPLPPLDGSGAIGLLLSEETARNLRRLFWGNPQLSMLGLIAAWFLIEPLFHPIHLLAVNLLYPGIRYG